jgi:glycosyltransferase involved in cell wall biosynthesis
MRRYLKLNRIQVLFAPSYWPITSLASALAAKSVGSRLVFMTDSHLASGRNDGLLMMFKGGLLKLYDSALVAGSMHRSFVRQLGMSNDKIFDGYDTVDNAYFQSIALDARSRAEFHRSELRLPRRYFLSLGRYVIKKNLEAVLRAFAVLLNRGANGNHDLVLVGAGPLKDRLMQVAFELGLKMYDHEKSPHIAFPEGGGGVHFYPFAQVDKVPLFYALATCFILASKVEEWGLVVNEAMACACPVIVSRSVGSSVDLVVSAQTGFRFSPENFSELAWFMEMMCSDTAAAGRMGERAFSHISAWSNERFARNALRAAAVALGQPETQNRPADEEADEALYVWFLQTCFPDYRTPVFSELSTRLGRRFHLFTGKTYFTPDIKTTMDHLEWHSLIENSFSLQRNFLFQRRACEAMFHPDIAVIELNPRVLSNWLILAGRAMWNVPTLVWGHAWGREDSHSLRNVLRLYMMRLATATITYTRSQREEVRKVFPGLTVFAAPNSLIRACDCDPIPVLMKDLDTIIYVGRLNRSKKPLLLIEGFLRANLPPQVCLKLVGDGPLRADIDASLAVQGVSGRVSTLGHVTNAEILRSLYSRAFCSVSPGYVGLGAIQSFSFGIPMVLADREPHAPEVEACRAGENTRFFNADDPDSLAFCLEAMWAEREMWLARRGELAAWTARNYSVEIMVDGFIEAIEAVSPAGWPRRTQSVAPVSPIIS